MMDAATFSAAMKGARDGERRKTFLRAAELAEGLWWEIQHAAVTSADLARLAECPPEQVLRNGAEMFKDAMLARLRQEAGHEPVKG